MTEMAPIRCYRARNRLQFRDNAIVGAPACMKIGRVSNIVTS